MGVTIVGSRPQPLPIPHSGRGPAIHDFTARSLTGHGWCAFARHDEAGRFDGLVLADLTPMGFGPVGFGPVGFGPVGFGPVGCPPPISSVRT